MEVEQKLVSEVFVRFISGPLNGKIISISKPVTEIGRDTQNDIVVFDAKVSRHHARIHWLNGMWTIENLSQSSFIAINQQRMQQGILQHNAVVTLGGDSTFVFLVQPPVMPQFPVQPSLPLQVTPQTSMESPPTQMLVQGGGRQIVPATPSVRPPSDLSGEDALAGTMLVSIVPSLIISTHSAVYGEKK